jgi:transposase
VNLAGRCFWHNAVLPFAGPRLPPWSGREHEKECLGSFPRPAPRRKERYAETIFALPRHRRHKESVTACVLVYSGSGEPDIRRKEFATHSKALGNLRLWLFAQKVTHLAMESTGVYWRPVWQSLENPFELTLANPFQVKNLPGRKTDARDAQWLAELFAHGLFRPSFVPSRETRELRDLAHYRVKLTQERNRVHNRIHKVLEDACIRLGTVASGILGATGRAIIKAIISGQEHPDWLADKANGTLRGKRPQLRPALRGKVTDHIG